jgi:hypothetical protein
MHWRSSLTVAALAGVVTCCCTIGYGQIVYGNIVGNVTDSSGASVPHAQVTVTNVGTGVSTSTMTNQSGYYEQLHLIVGIYKVAIKATGFRAFLQQNVSVNAGSSMQVNAVLQVGATTQTVTVTGAPPPLQTENTDVHTLYSQRSLQDLPTLNRNFSYFQLDSPGAQRYGFQQNQAEDPQGTISMDVNGQSFGGTGWLLDGTDNHDVILGIQVVNPNIDSLSETKVITDDYGAEYGSSDAGVVTATTKSGTNQVHGSAFEYRRTDWGQSRDPFAQARPNPVTGKFIPHTLWNEFGGSLGGPIRKDKTFIFGDYQGSRQTIGGSVLTFLPTQAMRNGDLSSLGVNIYDPFSASGSVLAPAQRTQFTGNRVPQPLIAPQSAKLLQYLPLPNVPGATGGLPNYATSGAEAIASDAFDARVDQYQTTKLHLFGRYSFQRYVTAAPGAFGDEAGGPGFAGYAGNSSVRAQSLASGFDYSMGPQVMTDFRLGFFRYRVFATPGGYGTSPASDAGIPGLNINSTYTSGMPAFYIGGVQTTAGAPGGFDFGYSLNVNGCNCLLNEQEQQIQFVNNWTFIHTNHTIEVGADIRHLWNLRVPSDSHRAGEVSFVPSYTEGPSGGGLGMATFLLGQASDFTRYVSQVTDAAERENRQFFFGQDTWHATRKLTFNYGLRWEIYDPQYVNAPGNGGFVSLANGEDYVAGTPGVNLSMNVRNSFTNLGPRAGIAYQMSRRTVLRLGYGRFFDNGMFGSTFGHAVTQNLPVLADQSVTPANNYEAVFSLANGPPALNPATLLDSTPVGPTGQHMYPNGVVPRILPPTMRLPTVDAWNITLQQEINPNTTFSLGWVANKGTHQFPGDSPEENANQPTIAGFNKGLTTFQREPLYARFGWTQGTNYYGDDASNNYESLQAVFNKRFSSSYSLNVSDTWSHDFYFCCSYFYVSPAIAYGPTDFNRSNSVIIQNIVQLPVGRGRRFLAHDSKALDYLVGGWQISGITTWETGLPFTPSYADCGTDEDVGICRPNEIGNTSVSNRTVNQWYAIAPAPLATAQTSGPWQRPMPGVLGNAPFDSMWGPGFFQSDMSIFKSFNVTEKLAARFEAEFFNIFNVANYGNPNTCVDCGASNGSGRITSLAPGALMRTMQFGLRLDF